MFKKGIQSPDNNFFINNLIVDVLKPVGPFKAKLRIVYDKIGFSSNQKIISILSTSKRSIFGQALDSKNVNSSSNEKVIELLETNMTLNFSL